MLQVLFSGAFRPLFLLFALLAPLAILVWLAAYLGYWPLFAAHQSPLDWHAHEMLFGIVGGAVGGFLFTAVANWTGRTPLQGGPLLLLVLTWLAGRAVNAPGLALPGPVTALVDLAYLALVALLLWRELYQGGNRRNYVILAVIVALLAANALYHAATLGWVEGRQWGIRAGTFIVVLLICVIGGRIIPAFTRNWLMLHRSPVAPPAEFNRLDGAAIAAAVLLVPCWTAWPGHPVTGGLLVLAAVLHAVRLARWRGVHTASEPLLLVLHVGYAWVPVGFLVLGAAILLGLPASAGVHALTVGAMTTMIMAVSARAAMGHTGRPLHAPRLLTLAYLLITLAAATRVVAALTGDLQLTAAAGVLWVLAFAAFLPVVTPILVQPRVDASRP